MLTGLQSPFHARHINGNYAHGEGNNAETNDHAPVDDQRPDAIHETPKESQVAKFHSEDGGPQERWITIVKPLVCDEVVGNVHVLFQQIEKTSGVIVEFLRPIQITDMGIAQDRAARQTETSKDEEVVVHLKTPVSFELQDQTCRSCNHSNAIEDTDQSLFAAVSRRVR